MTDRKHFKLAPSEFAYLWNECARCYYERRHGLAKRPDTPFPGIFNRIEGAVCGHLDGRSPHDFSALLPDGRVICRQRPVASGLINVPDHTATVSLVGRMDAWARFITGGFGVIDFKVAGHNENLASRYAPQLWSYGYALEHPAKGTLPVSPVTHLGLFVLESRSMADLAFQEHNWLLLHLEPQWCPVEPNEPELLAFLGAVLDVLELPEAPPPDPSCAFCKYRGLSNREEGDVRVEVPVPA